MKDLILSIVSVVSFFSASFYVAWDGDYKKGAYYMGFAILLHLWSEDDKKKGRG